MATLPPFQELLDEHGRDVLGFLVASVGPHDAEDCFQETFIAALRGYPKLEHADNLRSWLLTIAHRKAIDHHRARAARARPSGAAEEVGGGRGAADGALEAAGQRRRAVARWSARCRRSSAARWCCGSRPTWPTAQIGEMLDCSEEAARRNVHEGLKKLRGELA